MHARVAGNGKRPFVQGVPESVRSIGSKRHYRRVSVTVKKTRKIVARLDSELDPAGTTNGKANIGNSKIA